MKKFLYKIKKDIENIKRYPSQKFSAGGLLNYDLYWKKKRGGDSAVLSVWQKKRADYILKIVDKNSIVLDLGCGDGAILKYLKDKANIKGIGVDVSPRALNKAAKEGVEVIEMDINDFKSLKNLPKVDYILGLEIIEHMPRPEEFIYEIKDKARKSLIFSFPNSGYYAHRLRLLFGKFPLQWIVHPGEHLRFWTVNDVRWWVKYINFNLRKIIIYEGIPLLNKIFPNLFGQGIIIEIREK